MNQPNRIHVDPTLPAEQFNAELLRASRLLRVQRVAVRLKAKRLEAEFQAYGWGAEASRELALIQARASV